MKQVSLWADEGWTIAATAETNPVHVVTEWVVPDVHPPLYFLALSGWRAFTYFSVLVSLLGIAVCAIIGNYSGKAYILHRLKADGYIKS